MPIVLSEQGLNQFINNPSQGLFLQQATDLFTLATGLDNLPTDPMEVRIVTNAIYSLAWKLSEDHNNAEAYMSEFSSERIGGYSYSKMPKAIESGGVTNVAAFDFAVDYFANKGKKDDSTSSSEKVFFAPLGNTPGAPPLV